MAQDTSPPVILHKSNAEIFKSGIKNLLQWLGYSWKDWHRITKLELKENYSRLSDEAIERCVEGSAATLESYSRHQMPMSDKELTETCEWQTLSFIDDILRNDSVHKSVVNVGCSFVRAESTLCKKNSRRTMDDARPRNKIG